MIRKLFFLLAFVSVTALLVSGCAGPISKEVLRQADETATLDKALAKPDALKGTLVVWGGVILSTQPREKNTVIEILEKPLDYQKRPKDVDSTRGRFLARINGFLDPAVFSQGRDITVVGRLTGTEKLLIGSYSYTYPSLSIEEYHLWPTQTVQDYPTYPYYYPYYGPWWWY